jgi:hypothetical protein
MIGLSVFFFFHANDQLMITSRSTFKLVPIHELVQFGYVHVNDRFVIFLLPLVWCQLTVPVALLPFIMGKGWVRTPEQEEYLDSEFKGYLEARKKGEVKIWRAKLHNKWEERWPEKQVLINEWNLSDNTMFDTAQMDTLGKALAARKKVNCIYILQ